MNVLALTIKPEISPDTRYRILQYMQIFRDEGIDVKHDSMFNQKSFRSTSLEGRTFKKVFIYIAAWIKRFFILLFTARRYDAIWILRELSPIGPPLLERLVFRLNPCVILDIDDAVFLRDEGATGFIHKYLRDFSKFEKTASNYAVVVCGNDYLAEYFKNNKAEVTIIPTVVSADRYDHITSLPSSKPRLGWIGTPTNRVHFQVIKNAVSRLAEELDFELVIIGLDAPLDWNTDCVRYIPWELDKELYYLTLFDVGLMPLEDFEFTKGKCAFKIIQYMAAGIPVAASPVGANKEVVQHGVNGFLAYNDDDWYDTLHLLMTDETLRKNMGAHGKTVVKNNYSLEKWGKRYAEIIKKRVYYGKH